MGLGSPLFLLVFVVEYCSSIVIDENQISSAHNIEYNQIQMKQKKTLPQLIIMAIVERYLVKPQNATFLK